LLATFVAIRFHKPSDLLPKSNDGDFKQTGAQNSGPVVGKAKILSTLAEYCGLAWECLDRELGERTSPALWAWLTPRNVQGVLRRAYGMGFLFRDQRSPSAVGESIDVVQTGSQWPTPPRDFFGLACGLRARIVAVEKSGGRGEEEKRKNGARGKNLSCLMCHHVYSLYL